MTNSPTLVLHSCGCAQIETPFGPSDMPSATSGAAVVPIKAAIGSGWKRQCYRPLCLLFPHRVMQVATFLLPQKAESSSLDCRSNWWHPGILQPPSAPSPAQLEMLPPEQVEAGLDAALGCQTYNRSSSPMADARETADCWLIDRPTAGGLDKAVTGTAEPGGLQASVSTTSMVGKCCSCSGGLLLGLGAGGRLGLPVRYS
eukprot:CAMPEP_0172737066 /NCGR_PEP_ID=MMETSP1074-20121228/116695_1 /TAXON_ID=2916 /ORGANISM="Ceratium fusus, Strain PA161109" /LENGTH=200 /DNA_ID=CAMNT_0013566387 /DNA_START=72 /DNA_END=673 /DNA_ORIENTATION=-